MKHHALVIHFSKRDRKTGPYQWEDEWALFCDIFGKNLLSLIRELEIKCGWIFQHDDVSKHIKQINFLELPSQSQNLNLIENLWKELPLKITALEKICAEEWAKI